LVSGSSTPSEGEFDWSLRLAGMYP